MARRVVLDASVIAKWFLEEEYRDGALKIREDFIYGKIRILAPSILPFEVLNAIRFSRGDISPSCLEDIATSLSLYGFELYDLTFNDDYRREISHISLGRSVSVYDASYVALAKVMRTDLFTADERLIRRLKGSDEEKYVFHIKDYEALYP